MQITKHYSRNFITRFTAVTFIIVLHSQFSHSQNAGIIDSAFGTNGIATIDVYQYDYPELVSVDHQDRIYVRNRKSSYITRLLPEGDLDTEYGTNGTVSISNDWDCIFMQIDYAGKLVVGVVDGDSLKIFRLNDDSSLDPSFGSGGIFHNPVNVFSQVHSWIHGSVGAGGEIIVLGSIGNDLLVEKITASGKIDSSFSDDGIQRNKTIGFSDFNGGKIILQPNGTYYVASVDFVDLFNNTGKLDQSFGGPEGSTMPYINQGAADCSGFFQQSDRKLLQVEYNMNSGYTTDTLFITRITADGVIDSSYGINGVTRFTKATSVNGVKFSAALQPDDKLLVSYVTLNNDYIEYVARFNLVGKPDSTFGVNGIAQYLGADDFSSTTSVPIALQSDNKTVFTSRVHNSQSGDSKILVLRLTADQVPLTCAVPTGEFTNSIKATSVQVNWSAVAAANKYKVHYRKAGATTWSAVGSTNTYKKLKNLLSNTQYDWQVKSVCTDLSLGKSAWSATQNFTTLPARLGEDAAITSLEVYPNPFSSSTTISVSLVASSHTTIKLFDLAGRKMKTLVDENLSEGNHEVQLNREELSAGIYLLQVKVNGDASIIKVIIQ